MRKHALLAALATLVGATLPAGSAAASARPACGNHQALQHALDGLTGEHRLAGAVVEVVDPRCGTWAGGSGVADVRTGRPASVRDRVRIGSVTKTFTATVVLQLAAEGELSLDSTVEDHLPGLVRSGGYDGRAITVRQLLQQTSGLPDHADALADADVDWLRHHRFAPRDLVDAALRLPRPGPGWHYSTTNYVLAGLVVEHVTGRSVEDEVTRRIIDPLRLRDTYWPGMAEDIRGRHSHSYFTTEYFTAERDGVPVRVDGTRWNTSAGGAGGALISTPSDVNRFLAALLGGRLLPAEQLAEMRSTVPGDPERLGSEGRYGLGLITEPLSCGGIWTGHTGSTRAGHHTVTAMAPDGRRATIAINESPTTDAAADAVLAALDTALCPPRT
ncbi:serine hydrolase domain-containing protein [Kitasatospora purpeofusca]|uniref:serine hydrolase domain-containing protein n=1 Tax=Kitasatospora purpeofusca TaxID=67352 RepID=UPI002A5A5EF7|nr:serine hydrolase domain-containing protein [Kitasatospora purpeofusca]MDY0813580.1 serine hydrolase domain-containing protein [Kitasatospora purpeofusca]